MPCIPHTTVCCYRGLREGIRLSTNPSNIDIIARTRNRRCVHRTPERHNTDSSVTVHLHTESETIRIKRGVRQGDTIVPKLFTATLERKRTMTKIQRWIMAGWAAYAKHRDIFKSNFAICLKRQVYNSCVLPAMTYGAETWTLTKQAQNKLAAAQTKLKEVCSTSHTKIEGPTSWLGRGQKS